MILLKGSFLVQMIKNIFKNDAILRGKFSLIRSIITGAAVGICLLGITMPQTISADFVPQTQVKIVKNGHLTVCLLDRKDYQVVRTIKMVVTAYTSVPEETDDTPFITASGKNVADGIIANNMLPFGTKIKIPQLYGDKVFVVEDRMASYKSNYHIDIWMPEKILAVNFGAKTAEIQILEN